ncbi:MAG TPA: hypothetical protein VF589_04945 [Allosphingosinicella sp.]|jgi:hypothetical protein
MAKAIGAALLWGALLLGGCVSIGGPRLGSELVGRSARLVPARGDASMLHFAPDGTVESTFGRRSASGRWWIKNRRLCFLWAGSFRECWPYGAPLQPGRPRSIRSDRGNVVHVTLL